MNPVLLRLAGVLAGSVVWFWVVFFMGVHFAFSHVLRPEQL